MSMHLSRPARRAPARGAGILEVIIAMAVLAVAAAGAVMGLLNASRQVRDGQLF
jgi:type II secretory pathway component PulJ